MARITVEDCLDNVKNRFELVLVAAKRARDITRKGIEPLVPKEDDKAPVIALREIAAGLVDARVLEDINPEPIPTKHVNDEPSQREVSAPKITLRSQDFNDKPSVGTFPEVVLRSNTVEDKNNNKDNVHAVLLKDDRGDPQPKSDTIVNVSLTADKPVKPSDS